MMRGVLATVALLLVAGAAHAEAAAVANLAPAAPVTRDHDASPVPAVAPHDYKLTARQRQSAQRTHAAVAAKHDRAWAARQRRAIHQERTDVLTSARP